MRFIDFPIEKINKILSQITFDLPNFLGYGGDFPEIIGKVKFTGVRDLLSMGTKMSFIEYTLYLEAQDDKSAEFLDLMMGHNKEIHISTSDTSFFNQIQRIQNKLDSLLKNFSIDRRTHCSKVVNSTKSELDESLILEGKYDGITRAIVRDIIQFYKYQREGEFSLPEMITGDEQYNFPNFNYSFSVELDMRIDDSVETTDVDAEYLVDEDIIRIIITTNSDLRYQPEILQELIQELNEVVRHELEHVKQFNLGKEYRPEPKSHEKYYSQPDELAAQRAGFKRRSKQEKKPMEYLVRKWFEKNKNKYKMTPNQVERVIQRILKSK